MKERPINLKENEVLAILAGTKKQFRRVIKPQPQPNGGRGVAPYKNPHGNWAWIIFETRHGTGFDTFTCPFGEVGDRLWVREGWRASSAHDDLSPSQIPISDKIEYISDQEHVLTGKGHPPIHMPRWASRITLEITAVRIERLQYISERDVEAEGAGSRAYFSLLFDKINGSGSWAANPWVWVVEFKRVMT